MISHKNSYSWLLWKNKYEDQAIPGWHSSQVVYNWTEQTALLPTM
jgi:hypothetical protein